MRVRVYVYGVPSHTGQDALCDPTEGIEAWSTCGGMGVCVGWGDVGHR